MFITDPFYKRPWWDHDTMALDKEQVYHLSADRKTLTRVTDDLTKPNGITGTPDGKTLFVADIGADRTYRYDIQPDGALARKTLFCKKGSDGMTIDEKGNIYITGDGVTIFDKTGQKIDHIEVKEPWTANVSFGGKDHKTLFITASKCLYSIRIKYKGANAAK
jgi:gluconolactonase